MESRREAAIIFIFSSLLVLVSLFLVNFSVPSLEGPRQTETRRQILLQPNQYFEFSITITYTIWASRYGTFDNNTFYFDKDPLYPTLTSWDTGRLWFGLEQTNQTNDALFILLYPCSKNESMRRLDYRQYMFQGYTELFRTEVSQTGTYTFTIANSNSTEINPILHVHLEWETFEKPYIYFGIAGLVMALLTPVMALKINRKLLGLILATTGVVLVISGTILFVITPQQQLPIPVFCCIYQLHPIYCVRYLHGVLFDLGWLLVPAGIAIMLFYRKRKLAIK